MFLDIDVLDHIDQQFGFFWIHVFHSVIPRGAPSREIPWKSASR
jgi:hypothetical protein